MMFFKNIRSNVKWISWLLTMCTALAILSSCSKSSEEQPDEEDPKMINQSTSELPYKQGTEGYAIYRIPSMVISTQGTLLAFAEGRVNSRDDAGDIDIVLKRSTDNGKTWSDLIVVINDGKNRVGNPVPVVIPSTGRILLLYCWNYGASGSDRKIFLTYSDDDGVTWAKEKDISAMVKTPEMGGWYATGPCHGIVKERGSHKGRIIVPTNHIRNNGFSMIIYSDDNGDTWQMGARSPITSNESTVVELSNGDLMLNMRNPPESDKRTRVVGISSDGGVTFDTCYYDEQLTEPICQASIIFHSLNTVTQKGNILFSNPPGMTDRTNTTLKLSIDDGATWSKQLQYVPTGEYGAYSDLAVFDDGTIAILYELGYLNQVGIAFKTVRLSDLK